MTLISVQFCPPLPSLFVPRAHVKILLTYFFVWINLSLLITKAAMTRDFLSSRSHGTFKTVHQVRLIQKWPTLMGVL